MSGSRATTSSASWMARSGPRSARSSTTGFIDWIEIEWGSDLWKTATAHLTAMFAATGAFLAAALVGHNGYTHGNVSSSGLALTLIGFALLTTGGWLGGAVVFVH